MSQHSQQLAASSPSPAPLGAGVPGTAAAYWEKRLEGAQGLEGVGFINFGRSFNEWMYRVRKRVFLDQIAQLPIDLPNARVLDVGSGTGFWLKVWKSLGVKQLTASDITHVASRRLAEAHPENRVVQLDISSPRAVETLGSRYDLISAIDVLFHIISDDAYVSAITNVGRLLDSGGYFVLSENLPHRELPSSRTQVNRTFARVDEVIRKTGMLVIKRVPMFVLMNTPFDTRWRSAGWLWGLFMKPLAVVPALGNLYGAALYPLERLLLKTIVEGPSTELVICQKVQSI
jgi:SAM-dependent methyltransferase